MQAAFSFYYLAVFLGIIFLYFWVARTSRRLAARLRRASQTVEERQEDDLLGKIESIEAELKKLARARMLEKVWVTWYGAYDIDPEHLVYWVCVETDAKKAELEADAAFWAQARALLEKYDYPKQARASVHFGVESQQTVDRESDGNWWYHWK